MAKRPVVLLTVAGFNDMSKGEELAVAAALSRDTDDDPVLPLMLSFCRSSAWAHARGNDRGTERTG